MDTFGVLSQCLTVLLCDELKLCCAILHQMLFQLLIFNVLNVLFDSLSSFSQCLCMSLSKHDVCFQASMEEAVPSKEAEEASDEKRREPFFVLRCLAVVNEHHYHAKLPSLASK